MARLKWLGEVGGRTASGIYILEFKETLLKLNKVAPKRVKVQQTSILQKSNTNNFYFSE